jgi:hypothetical protein
MRRWWQALFLAAAAGCMAQDCRGHSEMDAGTDLSSPRFQGSSQTGGCSGDFGEHADACPSEPGSGRCTVSGQILCRFGGQSCICGDDRIWSCIPIPDLSVPLDLSGSTSPEDLSGVDGEPVD